MKKIIKRFKVSYRGEELGEICIEKEGAFTSKQYYLYNEDDTVSCFSYVQYKNESDDELFKEFKIKLDKIVTTPTNKLVGF